MAAGFIVTVEHNGETWPLRGTVWAYRMERAQVFDTRAAAQAQLDKAGKFMPAVVYRKAQIVPTESDSNRHVMAAASDMLALLEEINENERLTNSGTSQKVSAAIAKARASQEKI
jgi:hypothetical protein